MTISALGNSSMDVLSSILASGSSTSSTSSSSSTEDFSSSMTISQIRDEVDKMATSGELTTQQQMALIAAGFQDLDASNPSYQPTEQEGYTRSSTESVDIVSTLRSMSSFDAAQGNTALASTYSEIANLFNDKTSSSLNVTS